MLGDELIITLSIDFIALAIQLYLLNRDTPIYLDAIITIFLVAFNFASYLNGLVYVAEIIHFAFRFPNDIIYEFFAYLTAHFQQHPSHNRYGRK